MDVCLNCGGAIMEPGRPYGWVGKVCQCPVHPSRAYQNPASNPLPGTAQRYTGSAAHLAPGARVRSLGGEDLGPAD